MNQSFNFYDENKIINVRIKTLPVGSAGLSMIVNTNTKIDSICKKVSFYFLLKDAKYVIELDKCNVCKHTNRIIFFPSQRMR